MRVLSKYTTEVRFICEHEAGLEESKGANDVNNVLNQSWNKIFTTNCTFFDDTYRSILCTKILKHYYLREIASETVGIWKMWMNTKLEEIMPYYNKLYQSALLQLDPFKDTDYTKTHEGENDGTKNTDGSTSSTGSKSDRYSDTPQGTINNTDVAGDAYLTNVRLIGDTTSGTSHDTSYDNNLQTRNLAGSEQGTENTTDASQYSENNTASGTNEVDETTHSTDSYVDRIVGKMSTTPYSELLMKYRETFLNIDLMVIEEFDELFLRLW